MLKKTIEIKVLVNYEIKSNKDILFPFYLSKYSSGYEKAILNSSYIVVAIKDDKVVGALRIITDNLRFAFIVDFVVEENMRNQGIGTKLINRVLEVCDKEDIANIRLFSDPTNGKEWLVDFYKKLGFIEYEATSMEYKTK